MKETIEPSRQGFCFVSLSLFASMSGVDEMRIFRKKRKCHLLYIGCWVRDRGLFEIVNTREEVSNITTNNTDYLAIIPIGGGSSWGRDPDKEKAIANAVKALRDWHVHFDVSGIEVTVNVIDVQGYSQCAWGGYPDGYVHGKNETTGLDEAIKRDIEHVKRVTPKWKRRA